MKAFVAGATGRTGIEIVKQLHAQGIEVMALVRSRTKATPLLPEGVEVIVGDILNPRSWEDHLKNCDVLFCATGATPSWDFTQPYKVDYEGTKLLVDRAKSQGLRRFILISSLCVSQFFHPLNLFWLVLFWKQQAEKYIQASGLTYTIVRPGGLLSEDNSDRIVLQKADTLFEGRIPRTKVAEIAIAALDHDSTNNQIIEAVATPDAPEQPWAERFAAISS
ncbi:MAG: SDR family oxidoreductase [Spirulina sp. SIO3F2]|nr:SDR family oxidoreductase [Spirulina sp. SIO3F2]